MLRLGSPERFANNTLIGNTATGSSTGFALANNDGSRLIGNVGRHDNSQLHVWEAKTGRVLVRMDNAQGARTFSPDGKLLVVSVPLPVPGPLTAPVPTPMDVRIFQLSNKPVRSETRGEPIPIEGEK